MSTIDEVKGVLADVLQIGDRISIFTEETPMLGSIPEFDSMAVVSIITALEENLGFIVDDDEIDAEVFETLGNLVTFVESKI